MKYILLPFTFLFLFSCAQEQKTKATVSVRLASALMSDFGGSLILMGRHAQSQRTFFKEVGVDAFSVELPNGNWTFAAMGWEGGDGNFSGKSYCDTKPNIELSGGIINLSFNATNAGCSKAIFGGADAADSPNGFKQLVVNSCINIKNSFSSFSTAENSPKDKGCGMVSPGVPENGSERYMDGTHEYFKITMIGKNFDGSYASPVSSKCLSKDDLKTATSNIRLPMGTGLLPISYQIESFHLDNTCSSPDLTYTFANGFYQRDLYGETFVYNDKDISGTGTSDTNLQLEVFLNEPGCKNIAADLSHPNYALAEDPTGTPNQKKYLICNLAQFKAIVDAADANYFLGDNLSLVGADTIKDFKGSFYGGGHIIEGITRPLFSSINTNTKDIVIRDIVIDNAQIDFVYDSLIPAYTAFGILSDTVKASSSKTIKLENISINSNSYIRTSAYQSTAFVTLGGAIGSVSNLGTNNQIIINNLHSKATIDTIYIPTRAAGASIGGLIGRTEPITISKSSYEGKLLLDSLTPATGTVSAGGLIGFAAGSASNVHSLDQASVTIDKLNDGSPHQSSFGGLIGELESGALISFKDSLFKGPKDADLFNIDVNRFYCLIGAVDSTNTLTLDGFMADTRTINYLMFDNSNNGHYILPAVSTSFSLGPVEVGTNTFENILIIGQGLSTNSVIDNSSATVKIFSNISSIDHNYFKGSDVWDLKPINDDVTLKLTN